MMKLIFHTSSQASVETFHNIPTIFCHQALFCLYLHFSLPAYWARCNIISGESASIDAWECRGETPFLNTATGSHNCSYTGVACVCLSLYAHTVMSITAVLRDVSSHKFVHCGYQTMLIRRCTAREGLWGGKRNTEYDELLISGCCRV